MSLTKEQILAMQDFEIEEVKIPEWGGESVYVRSMTGKCRDNFEKAVVDAGDSEEKHGYLFNIRARYCALTACDEKGNLLFEPEDMEAIGQKSGAALDRIFEAARRLNKMSEEDVEEMTKKLESSQS